MDVAFIKTFNTTGVMASQVLGNKLVVFPTCLFLNANACICTESLLTESCKFGESKILPKCDRTENEYLTIILIVILNKLKTLWRLLA